MSDAEARTAGPDRDRRSWSPLVPIAAIVAIVAIVWIDGHSSVSPPRDVYYVLGGIATGAGATAARKLLRSD